MRYDRTMTNAIEAVKAAQEVLVPEYRAVFQDSQRSHREYGRWRSANDEGRLRAMNDLPQRPRTETIRQIGMQTRYVTREDSYVEEAITP